MTNLLHKKITDGILKEYYDVFNQLGYGFLEKVYQNAMYIKLQSLDFKLEAQKQIKVYFENQMVGEEPEFKRIIYTNDRKTYKNNPS